MATHLSLGTAIISGAIASAIGAGVFHHYGRRRRRRRLIKALKTEINQIQKDLDGQIEEMRTDGQAWPYEYSCEVFNGLSTADPDLYAELIDETEVDVLYFGLQRWNEDQIWLRRDEGVPLEVLANELTLARLYRQASETKKYLNTI